jgi:probable F420-dependent oxidoreductase
LERPNRDVAEWNVAHMKISVQCRPFAIPSRDPADCVVVARLVDAAGLYGIHFGEHVVMGEHPEAYPYAGVTYPHRLDAEWLEPITTLGAMAAVTSSLRLSTGVLLAPLRSAALLAKSLATLDVLAHGRTEIGIGIGWQREEYDASGVDWDSRYQRLLDTVRVCRALWESPQPVDVHTRTYSFERIYCSPRPVQQRLPLLFGWAMTPKRARLVADLGDGWIPSHVPIDRVAEYVAMLRSAFVDAGRDPSELIVRAMMTEPSDPSATVDVGRLVAEAHELQAAGATVVAIPTPRGASSLTDLEKFFQQLAEETA